VEHFSWMQLIPGVGHKYAHVATIALASLISILLGLYARVVLGSGEAAVIPSNKFSVRGCFEGILEFIVNLSEMVMGHDGKKYAPIFASIFVFILVNNLIGLLPGMVPATANLNTTFALGIFSFAMYHVYGVQEHGFAYIKQFMGPMLLLAPFMFCVELISHMVRPLSLGLRLMGNLQGDHAVLSIFLDLVPIGLPVVFYLLGLFVCFMQAFIFTTLSMAYIAMATAHDH